MVLIEDPEHCDLEMNCSTATASPNPRTHRESVNRRKPAKAENIAATVAAAVRFSPATIIYKTPVAVVVLWY